MLAAQHELELPAALELLVEAGLVSEFGLGGAGLLELRADEEPTAVEDTPTGGLLPRVLPPPPDEDVPEPPVFESGEVRGYSRGPREEDGHLRRGHRARPNHRGFCEGRGGIKLAT